MKTLEDILVEIQNLRNDVREIATTVELVRIAVIGISQRVGQLEMSPLTPLPRHPSDSWAAPDMGRK